jgi:hypothetical protein
MSLYLPVSVVTKRRMASLNTGGTYASVCFVPELCRKKELSIDIRTPYSVKLSFLNCSSQYYSYPVKYDIVFPQRVRV